MSFFIKNGSITSPKILDENVLFSKIAQAAIGVSSEGLTDSDVVIPTSKTVKDVTDVNISNIASLFDLWGVDTTAVESTYLSAEIYRQDVCIIDTDKALVVYTYAGDTYRGNAVVLSRSGSSIAVGTPYQFHASGRSLYMGVDKADTNKAVVVYHDEAGSNRPRAQVLSVSGTTITGGTPLELDTEATYWCDVTQVDTDKMVAVYSKDATINGTKGCVLTVTGTSLAVGTRSVLEDGVTEYISVETIDSTKTIAFYQNESDSNKPYAVVMNVGATTVTPGTAVALSTNVITSIKGAPLNATQVMAVYGSGSVTAEAQVLDISGTTITTNTPTQLNGGSKLSDDHVDLCQRDSTSAMLLFRDNADSYNGKAMVLSVASSLVTVGTEYSFNSGNSTLIIGVKDSDKYFVCYNDTGDDGYAKVITLDTNGEIYVGEIVVNLGTFAGSTLSDNAYAKQLFQELETAVETSIPQPTVVTKTTNYTATDSDDYILVDATAGNVTINLLPSASRTKNRAIIIKKIDASANTVIIDGDTDETIDGTTTKTISNQYDSLSLLPSGGNWFIF